MRAPHRRGDRGRLGGLGDDGLRGASDEELVEAVDSLGALILRWEQPLFRFVYRMLPRQDDARDICQETFLRILKKAHRFRQGSRFSTWMYQIALNQCRDQLRHRKRWGLLFSVYSFSLLRLVGM